MTENNGWDWGNEDGPTTQEVEAALQRVERKGRHRQTVRKGGGTALAVIAIVVVGVFSTKQIQSLDTEPTKANRTITTTTESGPTSVVPDLSAATLVAVTKDGSLQQLDPVSGVVLSKVANASADVALGGDGMAYYEVYQDDACGSDIYSVKLGEPRTAKLFVANAKSPTTSPDGSKLAYILTGCKGDLIERIRVRDLATGGDKLIQEQSSMSNYFNGLYWKGNVAIGTSPVMSGRNRGDVVFYDVNTTEITHRIPAPTADGSFAYNDIRFLDNGSAFAVMGDEGEGATGNRFVFLDPSGKVVREVVKQESHVGFHIVFASTDGNHLIYTKFKTYFDGNEPGTLYKMDNGSNPVAFGPSVLWAAAT